MILPYCLRVCVPPSNVAKQRLGKHFTAATNAHAAVELWDAVFSVRSVSYQLY
jgi:hypothetical protein